MFERLVHADWSSDARKRWMAVGKRGRRGWRVDVPRLVPSANEFVSSILFGKRSVLAGFDFPIGLPASFGRRTGFEHFSEALDRFGSGKWADFYSVADRPSEISIVRPFYPDKPRKGHRQLDLLRALGVNEMDALRRLCERKTSDGRRAACPLFWTLGGNQVGKAAIDGWQTVLRLARARGARLWPFEGSLGALSKSAECVLCETYPQEAYRHMGVKFRRGGSKRNRDDRKSAGDILLKWATTHAVALSKEARDALFDGFGPSKQGEDPFDALVGLLSMVEVVEGRRNEGGEVLSADVKKWEGWILGQRGPLTS